MATYAGRTLIKIKTARQMYSNITVERLEQIERERELTMADQAYQRWMKDLQVGSMYVDKILIHNANHAMREWDSTRLNIERITIK
jgi:uncharacterized protein (UPF0128 family)